METNKEVQLKSGAKLKMSLASFAEGRNLYQSIASELKSLELKADDDLNLNLIKECFLSLLISKRVEACIWECCKKAIYNDEKVSEALFDEKPEAREDYIEIMKEVAIFNAAPFMKNLFAELEELQKEVTKFVQE